MNVGTCTDSENILLNYAHDYNYFGDDVDNILKIMKLPNIFVYKNIFNSRNILMQKCKGTRCVNMCARARARKRGRDRSYTECMHRKYTRIHTCVYSRAHTRQVSNV